MDRGDAQLIGLSEGRGNCNKDNFKEKYGDVVGVKEALEKAKLVVMERKNVLIVGSDSAIRSHLGIVLLKAMVANKRYLDVRGEFDPEKVRYIRADEFVSALNNSVTHERKLMWDNLFIAYDDGSGWVRSIMIDGLGDEYGKDAENYMKLIIRKCVADGIQFIVTTNMVGKGLKKRYGEEVSCLLMEADIVNLRGEKDEDDGKKPKRKKKKSKPKPKPDDGENN